MLAIIWTLGAMETVNASNAPLWSLVGVCLFLLWLSLEK